MARHPRAKAPGKDLLKELLRDLLKVAFKQRGDQSGSGASSAAAPSAAPPGPIGATIQTMPAKFSHRNDVLDHMPVMAWPLPLNA